MNIGQLVKELKKSFPSVTISRIRFLEKEGLIKPKRSSGGTRIFTDKDLKKLNKILDLQENQFYSLKAIKNNSSLLTKKDTKQIIISEYSKHDVLKNSGISDKEFDELVKYEFEDEKEITPTAVGAFGALVLSYFYKTLKWKNFKESVFLTAKTTAMIMWLFIGSWTFASVFSYLGGHEVFEHFFKSMNLQPWQFLVITQIIIFLLGWPTQ